MVPNKRDLVIAQIEHRETDMVPYTLTWEEGVDERLTAHYGSDAWQGALDNAIRHVPTPDLVVPDDAPARYTDPYGTTWRLDRRPYHLETPALAEPSLEGYTFPDLAALYTPEWRAEAEAACATLADHFTVAGFGFGLFERVWTLRGFENALMDSAGDPDFYDELVEAVAEHQMEILDHLLALPVDGIMFSDDWGYQHGVLLGNARWRRFMKPRLERMYRKAHDAGKYTLSHCCGSVADIMPDLIEIGLDVLESVQPEARGMNPYELKRAYGADMTFWGGLGSQSTIPFGTPEEIRAEVARLRREMSRGGGYILAPAKALQPETPVANAVAVVEAFLDG